VQQDLSVLERAFERAPTATRGGDYKIAHTDSVHADSIGHGKRLPVEMLPEPLLGSVNTKLEALGYEAIGPLWNVQPAAPWQEDRAVGTERLARLMGQIDLAGDRPPRRGLRRFAVAADDHRALRWVVDPSGGQVSQGEGHADRVVTGSVDDLMAMITGEENLGVLIQTGRIRYAAENGGGSCELDSLAHELIPIVELLRRE
jgi:SCP-2 sterol transfer family